MRTLTYVSSYYNQPFQAERWWTNMRAYGRELRERISFVFVDDGSQEQPLVVPRDIREEFQVRLFRVLEDIPWNEMGARNLAMKHVEGWALLMDADYVLPFDQAQRLLDLEPNPRDLYFPRARLVGTTEHLHHPVNLFLLDSELYWAMGGYHEEYAGGYGLSDTELLRVHSHGIRGTRHKLPDVWIDHFSDGRTAKLDRSLSRNDKIFRARLAAQNRMGPLKLAKMNKHLAFKWEEETWTS